MGIILSQDFFEIDDVSSHTVGVYVDTPRITPCGQRRYTEYEAIDFGEAQSYAERYYDDIEVTLDCYTFDKRYDTRELYRFLHSGDKLKISGFTDYYYKIKQVYAPTPDYQQNGKTYFSISFKCSPFRYSAINPEIELINGGSVDNSGSVFSRPIYKLHIKGNGRFIVNDEILTFVDMPEKDIAIDCERMLIHDNDGNVWLNHTAGQLPFLNTTTEDETNIIAWSGGISNVRIIKNERWL